MLAKFHPCSRRRQPMTVPLRCLPIPQHTSSGYDSFRIIILSAAMIDDSVNWSHGLVPSVTRPRCSNVISLSSAKLRNRSLGSSTASQTIVFRLSSLRNGKLIGDGWPLRYRCRSTGAKFKGGTILSREGRRRNIRFELYTGAYWNVLRAFLAGVLQVCKAVYNGGCDEVPVGRYLLL